MGGGKPFDSRDSTMDYFTSNTGGAEPATYKEINAELVRDCGLAKLWKEGYTYYYADIKHLGAEGSNGWKGICATMSMP